MGINSAIKEIWAFNMLKKKGYSLIDVTGNDGVVRTYFMRIGPKKEIKIGKNTYIINKGKKMMKGGMPYFRFNAGRSAGENKDSKISQTPMDDSILTEIIQKARIAGQNSSSGMDKNQMFLYIGLGGAVGFLLCWIVSAFI